jgi:hypothetical protein
MYFLNGSLEANNVFSIDGGHLTHSHKHLFSSYRLLSPNKALTMKTLNDYLTDPRILSDKEMMASPELGLTFHLHGDTLPKGGIPMLKDEVAYYRANQDAIVAGHIGDFVLIENRKVLGYYNDVEVAFAASAGHELGQFMLTDCLPKGEDMVYIYNQEPRFA